MESVQDVFVTQLDNPHLLSSEAIQIPHVSLGATYAILASRGVKPFYKSCDSSASSVTLSTLDIYTPQSKILLHLFANQNIVQHGLCQ